jgi:hypothetical protein
MAIEGGSAMKSVLPIAALFTVIRSFAFQGDPARTPNLRKQTSVRLKRPAPVQGDLAALEKLIGDDLTCRAGLTALTG